jgi:hypothetical protein
MPAVLHTQLSEAINRIALLSASFMQAVLFLIFFVSLPLYSQLFFFYMSFTAFSIIIQYVSIAAVPYRVQQQLNLCCATIQGGTAIFTLLFCAAAAPHRVQQQK